jgi:hypothetical protein
MQFGPPLPPAGYANFDPRRPYGGIPGPGPTYPQQFYPPWNGGTFHPPPGPPLRPTSDGWYIPRTVPPPHMGQANGLHPANGPRSPELLYSSGSMMRPPPPINFAPGSALPHPEPRVHEFWKGRFAPFPGSTSPPGLLRKTTSHGVAITAPRDQLTQGPGQHQPPHPSSSPLVLENNKKTISNVDSEVRKIELCLYLYS